jgi:hypothetical protein
LINADFEFVFTGIDLEDEKQKIENASKMLSGGMTSFEKQFELFEGEPYDPKKHTILNSAFLQQQQMKMYGGQESNQAVDQMTGEPDAGADNPFDQFGKGYEDNPILRSSLEYLNKEYGIEK